MARGKRWTDPEINQLEVMLQKGMNLNDIVKSGKMNNRTPQAIAKQIERLGSTVVRQNKNPIVGQIREAEIVGLETIVKRYIDAFNKICDLTQYKKEDLERFRIIFMAAWKYRDLFLHYEKFKEVEQRVAKLETLVEQLQTEKNTETPKQQT